MSKIEKVKFCEDTLLETKVGILPFDSTNDKIRIDDEWYSFVSFNGNIYIDGAFSSGGCIPEQEELAFDMFVGKVVREVIEEVTGRNVFVIDWKGNKRIKGKEK